MSVKTLQFLIPDAINQLKSDVERRAAGKGAEFHIFRTDDPDDIPKELWERADALLVWLAMPINKDVIGRLKRARLVVRGGVGYDHIDGKSLGEAGIPLCNVPDYGTTDVADMAMALMLALARGITFYHEALRADIKAGWSSKAAPIVRRIRGQRFGVVGLGRIGTATALRAKAMGCHVMAYDPYMPWGHELAVGVERMPSLEALLKASDVVTLHTPLTDETRHLIDGRAFSVMKRNAILINTSRGPVIDIDALHEALRKRRIAGAGIDVMPDEPPSPDHPLIRAYHEGAAWLNGRLILAPHAAWYTPESDEDLRRKLVETAMAYMRHGELRNCVNLQWLTRRR
ncbi:MAG: C-terminal binding protein [Alphaproteobacteria bacterium]|nr:C-terminal binding protein [Alphaproteobacteria bacterium]